MLLQDPDTLNFSGCISVRQNDRILIENAYGYADWPNQIPNTIQTKFQTASAGKVFVATGILQMVERGSLRLEDPIGMLLPASLLGSMDPNVTVEQLLTHTSGVPDYFDETVLKDYQELWEDFPNYKIRTNNDLFPLFHQKSMIYCPGTRFQYNNSGYVILAAIMEQLEGTPFDKTLQKYIFEPCGMKNTGYYELDMLPAGCANGYLYDEKRQQWRTNIFCVDAKGTGAGGAYTTVGDIALFWRGLLEGTLLSAPMCAEMFRSHSGNGQDPEEGYYGYGVWVICWKGKEIPYFQGCDPGISFFSEYEPVSRTLSILVSNRGNNVWRIMRKIRKQLYP